jgi:hypothetical protein
MLLIVAESAKRSFTSSCKKFKFDAKLSFALLLRFALFASLRSAIFNLLKRKSIITLEMAEQSEANRAKRSFASNFLKFYTLRRSFASRLSAILEKSTFFEKQTSHFNLLSLLKNLFLSTGELHSEQTKHRW